MDHAFLRHLGLSATQVITVFHRLLRRTEEALTARLSNLRGVIAQRSDTEMICEYFARTPGCADSAEDLLAFVRQERLTRKQVESLIISHADLRLPSILTMSTDELARDLDVDADGLERLLRRVSLSFGEVSPNDPERLFLDNPVWSKPLIRVADRRYFCALPQVLFSFIFPIFSDLASVSADLQESLRKRRFKFLETEIERLFSEAFPGCEISRNVKWTDGMKQYENDVVVRIDSHLILVEAKAGGISRSALRGAPARAQNHIRDLLYEPSRQSARLAEQICAALSQPSTLAPSLKVSLDAVRTVLRLSVTLEDFATIQSALHQIKPTGWIPSEHRLAPSITLADLEVVFDVLHSAGQRLHYLRRRAELEEHMKYTGGELDLLGLYLSNGLSLGDVEYGPSHLFLLGMSADIDDYYSKRAEGIESAKPRLRLTKWWNNICLAAEKRAFDRWTDAVGILLNFSSTEQRKAESEFRKIRDGIRRKRLDPGLRCAVVMIPHHRKTDAVALYAFNDDTRTARWSQMRNVAAQTLSHDHVERCLVLAVDAGRGGSPYSSLAVYFRGEEDSGDDLPRVY